MRDCVCVCVCVCRRDTETQERLVARVLCVYLDVVVLTEVYTSDETYSTLQWTHRSGIPSKHGRFDSLWSQHFPVVFRSVCSKYTICVKGNPRSLSAGQSKYAENSSLTYKMDHQRVAKGA